MGCACQLVIKESDDDDDETILMVKIEYLTGRYSQTSERRIPRVNTVWET